MPSRKKEKKEQPAKKKKDYADFRPFEGTAFDFLDMKEKNGRYPIWINREQIEYEIELKALQIELMKLQKSMKAKGERIVAIF